MKNILSLTVMAAVLVLFSLVSEVLADESKPYQPQHSRATIGKVKVTLEGPGGFNRIDGLDQHLDDILLATQPENAAALAIYAEPQSWKAFKEALAEGSEPNEQVGLHSHALITTPANMAGENISLEDFGAMMNEMAAGLESDVNQERDLTGSLGMVSNHQVEQAKGSMESFKVLGSGADYMTYSLDSKLDMKFKGVKAHRVSRTRMVSTTMLAGGKIINLQLLADDQGPSSEQLATLANAWRESFTGKNSHLKN